ncbi:U-box domain-containing protein 35-like [Juglans regia]|uniref:RING-type E3 ubiquitin transferase n=1 Tax=Juglans regia TaxID=51240 RepID=A0A6P9EEI1_JUGRE|nr:U-box domain-containing protein 35-like [Juglans regia]
MGNPDKKEAESVAVAIDRDKGSQYALKWTVDHLLTRGQALTLVHVNQRVTSSPKPRRTHKQLDNESKDLFLPYRCFCTRKGVGFCLFILHIYRFPLKISCNEVVLENMDIAKALTEYISATTAEILVVGASTRGGLVRRFMAADVPSSVLKAAPDFCTVYVISKGKISSVRSATAPVPAKISPHNQMQHEASHISEQPNANSMREQQQHRPSGQLLYFYDNFWNRSPFTRHNRTSMNKSYELSTTDTHDISFVSSGRPSIDQMFPSIYGYQEPELPTRISTSSEFDYRNFGSSLSGNISIDHELSSPFEHSSSLESRNSSCSSQIKVRTICLGESHCLLNALKLQDEVEAEMRRLKLELKQTMDMYSTACKQALTAKQKARELHLWKLEEEQRLEEARLAEEAALAVAEKEKAKCKVALEAAEAARRLAQLEAQKRVSAEMKALKDAEERKKATSALMPKDIRYRRYPIEAIEEATDYFSASRKIGEGGYGPVYMCELDHTPVAVKVLRPDAAQGEAQFHQEVEVLSCIRHPNMVLLLGACPEYGCLVYEYMANGSLEDRLFRRGNTPVLPWQLRFRIAAEIGTGLLFLHQTKPEPLVHRDLKPGNILLDRNYVSKISDVGLARLVPSSVADSVTQYRMTSTAGTFCYIDPEYQQTGMLGIKSDIYSLGVLLLQIITAKPPMGLTHHVERSIERGTFEEMLDPSVPDWPVEEALKFAKLALQCAEMRRKDRPDLGKVVLPELNRLRVLAEDSMNAGFMMSSSEPNSPRQTQASSPQVS